MRLSGTLKILGICIALQLLQTLYPDIINAQALDPERLQHLSTFLPGLLGFIVYQFSHAGWGHLVGNFMIGVPAMLYVEHHLGERRLLEAFVISGIASALLFFALPIHGSGIIGSSGSVFGMLALGCMLLGKSPSSKLLAIGLLAVWLVPQLAALQTDFLGSNVAHSGHVGGALAGMLLYYCGYTGLPMKQVVCANASSRSNDKPSPSRQ